MNRWFDSGGDKDNSLDPVILKGYWGCRALELCALTKNYYFFVKLHDIISTTLGLLQEKKIY